MIYSENLILIWLLAYMLPLAVAGAIAFSKPASKRTRAWIRLGTLVIHIGLLVSIAASQYATYSSGLSFPWTPAPLSLLLLAAAVVVAAILLGAAGLVYAVSAFVQQATMLSVAYLLLRAFPVWPVVLLIMPIYVVLHFLSTEKWKLRMVLLILWGSASILLFSAGLDIYLVAALHAALGAFFISRSIISPKSMWTA